MTPSSRTNLPSLTLSFQTAAATIAIAMLSAVAPAASLPGDASAGGAWRLDERWRHDADRWYAAPTTESDAVVTYTVPEGGAGFYAVRESLLQSEGDGDGRVQLRVFVRHAAWADDVQPGDAVYTVLDAGEPFDFDCFLGYLDAGDTVHVSIGAADGEANDRVLVDFKVEPAVMVPVSRFPDDAGHGGAVDPPGGWSLASGAADSAAARHLSWTPAGRSDGALSLASGGAAVVAFRAPQSGYYALHDAAISAASAEARVYVAGSEQPIRVTPVRGHTTLNTDLGYLARGDAAYLVITGDGGAKVEASIVEWAPRRAPLRVRRGDDGYMDVFTPEAPTVAIDIPADRWIEVPAMQDDATDTIHAAFVEAHRRQGDGWVGIRLAKDAVYTICTDQESGNFIRIGGQPNPRIAEHHVGAINNLVFDGNGATLRFNSPEVARREIQLFVVNQGDGIVFADAVVEASTIPFTIGRVLAVEDAGVLPNGEDSKIVTFRVEPDQLDPLADIARNGQANGYAYDPLVPGRMGLGVWTNYPEVRDAPIEATREPGVFRHPVRRTMGSINVGDKWLIKNKRGGIIYLRAEGSARNITLSGIDGRASGGGALRFWHASAVNILDCRFEPQDHNWISSSADSVHGRAREGVWIENTVIRGVCEDIMNTYGETLGVVEDDNPADNVVSIRRYNPNAPNPNRAQGQGQSPPQPAAQPAAPPRQFSATAEPADPQAAAAPPPPRNPNPGIPSRNSIREGDTLTFFNPSTGQVLGYATVLAIDNGAYTLSRKVEGLVYSGTGAGDATTMVYSNNVAANFFVRDSRFTDSMRFGIYVKARGGVIFNNHFEGLSSPSVFVVNEPEWPEGPPGTHLWVQGNTFSRNNHGFMSRHRDFLVADSADISIYTRRFHVPPEPDDFRAYIVRGQHANSHMKLVGNVFHDWRGMGISVRNARNVQVQDNLFLPPLDDPVTRATLAADAALATGGKGHYAAIFLDTVGGARVDGNRFLGFSALDRDIVHDQGVQDVVAENNTADVLSAQGLVSAVGFDEWFGDTAADVAGGGPVALHGAAHRIGRVGAGFYFDSQSAPAARAGAAVSLPDHALTVSVWLCPDEPDADRPQVVYALGDQSQGTVLAIDGGRLVAGVWRAGESAWLDLGPAVARTWRQVTVACDGAFGTLRGYVGGAEIAAVSGAPTTLDGFTGLSFGGVAGKSLLPGERTLDPGDATFRGCVDEFAVYSRTLTDAEIEALAMR